MNDRLNRTKPSVFIETYGCQMNKYDTELVSGLLLYNGYTLVDSCDQADIVLVNTCSIRHTAEERALGRIAVLSEWRRKSPGRKLGVIGCMSQRMGADLLKKRPNVDFIVGPDAYRSLPEMIDDGLNGPCIRTDLKTAEVYQNIRPERRTGVTGWIAISRGCDNYCSYCIVPYTRGRERSRPAEDVLAEAKSMVERGFKEICFLGQNVNAYRDGADDFAGLLRRVSRIEGLLRIRFMTSHPKDLSEGLLTAMSETPVICPHLHLPVQSGSNRVLEAMNRRYTREQYLDLVEKARAYIPGIAITSDVMVGFPGETGDDFEDTMHLVEAVRFDEAFTYAYSPRSGTRAAAFPDAVPHPEKMRRLDELIRLQRGITSAIRRCMIGSTVEVLPEKSSQKSEDEWMGRTPTNHVVVFPKGESRLGEFVRVRIESCRGATLWGRKPVG